MTDLLGTLKGACSEERVFKVAGISELTVWTKEKGFRKHKFIGSEEFFLSGVREGKRSDFILEFTPVDSQPYERMEIESKKIEQVQGVEDHLVSYLRGTDHGDHIKSSATFKLACSVWAKTAAKVAEIRKEQAEEEARQAVEDAYANAPGFGAF